MKHQRLNHGWWFFLVLFLLGLGVSTCSFVEHQRGLESHYALERPGGNGPFPAVMMVPGCSGFSGRIAKSHYARVAKKLKNQGFVVLRVDYLAARGLSSCWPNVSQEEVAKDIVTAMRYLRFQSFVKTAAINVLGWSYGGGGALIALSEGPDRSPARVGAVVAYYPDCQLAGPWEVDVPVLVLSGSKDNVVSSSHCKSLLSQKPARDHVKFLLYPDAHHGFDSLELPSEMQYRFGTLGYNEKAAKAAWEVVEGFLRR